MGPVTGLKNRQGKPLRVDHFSGYLLPQFSNEDLLVLQNVGIDIEDMQRIFIFSYFSENYSLLNLFVFE
jgi:hypothetical protein